MSGKRNITMILSTYNRAKVLRTTLESMAALDTEGLDWEIVVVDNNSSDETRAVIESFAGRLPVRYLFEPRPGKNCALNKALDESELGQIVVFTDDDIVPVRAWLKLIRESVDKNPDISVFGGKITLLWPAMKLPAWSQSQEIMEVAFGWHDRGDKNWIYSPYDYPIGANFWVRREIFDKGRRYNEQVAWHPKNWIMGTETSFLKVLREEGYAMLYVPQAAVGHWVQAERIKLSNLWKRAYRSGRGVAYSRPPYRHELLSRAPLLWRFLRITSLIRLTLKLGVVALHLDQRKRVEKMFVCIRWFGFGVETLKVTRADFPKSSPMLPKPITDQIPG